MDDVTALRARIDQLEFENEQLRTALGEYVSFDGLPALTRTERRIISLLALRPRTHDQLYAALYADRASGPYAQVVSVFISRLRKKLKDYGIEIKNEAGIGYRLPDASLAIVERHRVSIGVVRPTFAAADHGLRQ